MLRNGLELLAPGNIDCEPCMDRLEEDMGLELKAELFGGELAMARSFI